MVTSAVRPFVYRLNLPEDTMAKRTKKADASVDEKTDTIDRPMHIKRSDPRAAKIEGKLPKKFGK